MPGINPGSNHPHRVTTDQTPCSDLDAADSAYGTYIPLAIEVTAGSFLDPLAESIASAVVRFEITHVEPVCQVQLADACVLVVARNADIRFVAPDPAGADNYVSYWHREPDPLTGAELWAPLSVGQASNTHRVRILGQTLPQQIAPEGGAGYLHFMPNRDGWTVGVGLIHPDGIAALAGVVVDVVVAARPYRSPETAVMSLTLH